MRVYLKKKGNELMDVVSKVDVVILDEKQRKLTIYYEDINVPEVVLNLYDYDLIKTTR